MITERENKLIDALDTVTGHLKTQEEVSSDLFARIDAFKAEYRALAGVAEARITVPSGEEDSSLVPDLWIETLIKRHFPC